MEYDEVMTENFDEAETEELPEGFTEEDESTEEPVEDLIEGETEDAAEEPSQKQEGTTAEPGYVKRRIEKAVQKAIAETEARMNARFEEQMAPFRERMLEDEARELVRQGTVKDLETAKELVRYRQGQPKAEPAQAPREEQPAPRTNPAQEMQINMLAKQADKIKAQTGLDVIDIMSSDESIRQKVMSGEMDFYDVAEMAQKSGRRPPTPMRSPNGASGQSPNAIDQMSDAQFKRLEKRIAEGARITLR